MSPCQLAISDLRLWVHLGCTDEEKTFPQAISVNIQINFATMPVGTTTDSLADTFCYANTVKNIQEALSKHQPFNLIEHLTSCVYASVYHDLKVKKYTDVNIEVKVDKLNPPIPAIQGGVSFICKGVLKQEVHDDLYQHWF